MLLLLLLLTYVHDPLAKIIVSHRLQDEFNITLFEFGEDDVTYIRSPPFPTNITVFCKPQVPSVQSLCKTNTYELEGAITYLTNSTKVLGIPLNCTFVTDNRSICYINGTNSTNTTQYLRFSPMDECNCTKLVVGWMTSD